MKIQFLSDVHLEFGDFKLPETDADVIVLAGDIHPGVVGIEWALESTTKPVIYVLGNHEFYHYDYKKNLAACRKLAKGSHVHVLERNSVVLNGVRFLGCSLWTDYNLYGQADAHSQLAELGMNDYYMISNGDDNIEASFIAGIHKKSVNWLLKQRSHSEPLVVVSHHAPTERSLHQEPDQDPLLAAYASELSPLIQKLDPKLWIHGHLHFNSDYFVGSTRVMANPRGYTHRLNADFNPTLVVEI